MLEDLECVRKRPGMYIGDPRDGSGLHRLLQSLIELAIDEHLDGFGYHLSVTIRRNGAYSVEHDGRSPCWGPPTEIAAMLEQRMTRRSTVRPPLDRLGWPFAPLVATALSEWLGVEVRREGSAYRQSYRRGIPEGPVTCVSSVSEKGWRVDGRPDPSIFASVVFDAKRVLEWLRPLAFLNPGLRVEFVDERPGGLRETLHGADIGVWAERLTEGMAGFPCTPLRLRGAGKDMTVDVALRWTRFEQPRFIVYGNHVLLRSRIDVPVLRGVAKVLRRATTAKGGTKGLRGHDLEHGLVLVAQLRGTSLSIGGCCHDSLLQGPEVFRAIQAVVARAMARELDRDPTLLARIAEWLGCQARE